MHTGFCLLWAGFLRAGKMSVCLGWLEATREITALSMRLLGNNFDFVGGLA